MKQTTMITAIPISKARLKLGELTNRVFRKENIYILSKSGLPVAAIISMDELDKLGLIRAEQLDSLIRDLGHEADKKGITEEKLEEMMEETRSQVYQKTYAEKE
ncbi:MAG: type II toxin-antitoxin system prevent-host-death family antitoxin [Nitrospinae bacterium]|nr:type II toxin-antitoxin system prevent-host-death family antitoxin [Nitrospinota bacterium]